MEVIFSFLTSIKCDSWYVGKAMIQVVKWYFEVNFCLLAGRKSTFYKSIKRRFIFCLLKSPKFVLDEVDNKMFQVLSLHFDNIFSLFSSPKCDFIDVNIAMFQVVCRHCELIFSLMTNL